MRCVLLSLAAALAAPTALAGGQTVLVTGATGRTGSQVYGRLKRDPRVGAVRALVRDLATAKGVLNCTKCDASEGIYLGDVTKPDTLTAPMAGVDALVIAVGVPGGPDQNVTVAREVEFEGVQNQVAALGMQHRPGVRVVLCSSLGTTNPQAMVENGDTMFWKLNAEAFLGGSGVPSVVVKPCVLNDTPGGQVALATSHDDKLPGADYQISRADVATVMAEAAFKPPAGGMLRFLLCVGDKTQPPTTDYDALLKSAAWPWW